MHSAAETAASHLQTSYLISTFLTSPLSTKHQGTELRCPENSVFACPVKLCAPTPQFW